MPALTLLRQLAQFHEDTAAAQFELAKTMVGNSEEDFRANGARHLKWAEELRATIRTIEGLKEMIA